MDLGQTPISDKYPRYQRGRVAGTLILAIVVVILPLYFPLFPFLGESPYTGVFLSLGLMAVVPFALARLAPGAAGFDVQWFPSKWSHWMWFAGMVVLLFVCGVISMLLADLLPLTYTPPAVPPGYFGNATYAAVIVDAIIFVLLCPIVEEIFWRGYALEQLRKLTGASLAVLIQALLFSLAHLWLILPYRGGFGFPIAVFLCGVVLGVWRVRFRCLLPLILAHMILNGVVSIPIVERQYSVAGIAADSSVSDIPARIRTSPKCQEIYRLTKAPNSKAIPGVIAFLADPDEATNAYATYLLMHHYGRDAEPYLKKALESGDKKVLGGVLFVVEMERLTELQPEVRNVVWSVDDPILPLSTVLTLSDLGDADGLRDIAQRHPNEKVREAAKCLLRRMEDKK